MPRIKPLPPGEINTETHFVRDEIFKLITRSQGLVNMINEEGALLGPFPPTLRVPQFGVPTLTFIQSLNMHATLDKRVRKVAILTVGGAFQARLEISRPDRRQVIKAAKAGHRMIPYP